MHRADRSSGFTLVELLVVMAVIGILVGLLMPAVQMVRESARRTSCQNNLKQMGLAVQNHHDTVGRIPAARGYDGFLTWPVYLMPFLEQQAFQDQLDLKAKYAAQDPAVLQIPMSVLFCPTRRGPGEISSFEQKAEPVGAVGDYAGNAGTPEHFPTFIWADVIGEPDGVFSSGLYVDNPVVSNRLVNGMKGRYRLADVTDGLTQTVFIGEKAVSTFGETQPGGWGDGSIYNGEEPGTAMRLGGPGFGLARTIRIEAPGPGAIPVFGSYHPQLVNFSMGDGSVQGLSVDTDEETLRRLCSRNDGSTVSFE